MNLEQNHDRDVTVIAISRLAKLSPGTTLKNIRPAIESLDNARAGPTSICGFDHPDRLNLGVGIVCHGS